MSNIDKMINRTKELEKEINLFLDDIQSNRDVMFNPLNFQCGNEDERFLLYQMKHIENGLIDVLNVIQYMSKPIKCEGTMVLNSDGKCVVQETGEICESGSQIEVYVYDELIETHRWVLGTLRPSEHGWYISGCFNTDLYGVKIRIR